MAEQEQPKQRKSAKSATRSSGGLAPVQGSYEDPRPAEETPGDPAHLGGERPYEGGDSPFVEGDEAAQQRGN